MGDGEHDGEARLDGLASVLDLGRERTKDHGSIIAGQNVVHFEVKPLDQSARVLDECGDGAPAGLFPDPGQHAGIARDLHLHLFAEQRGDLGGCGTAAHAAEKLLRDVDDSILTYGHLLLFGGRGKEWSLKNRTSSAHTAIVDNIR
jgi:hypothetical protein